MLLLSAWLPEALRLGAPPRLRSHGFMRQLVDIVSADELGDNVDSRLDALVLQQQGRRARALVYLLHGQLWLRRKRVGAWRFLDEGLRLADGLLKSEDYFVLVNRHELLRRLVLQQVVQPIMTLQALLNEAAVIERLQAGQARVHFNAHRHDTLLGSH